MVCMCLCVPWIGSYAYEVIRQDIVFFYRWIPQLLHNIRGFIHEVVSSSHKVDVIRPYDISDVSLLEECTCFPESETKKD